MNNRNVSVYSMHAILQAVALPTPSLLSCSSNTLSVAGADRAARPATQAVAVKSDHARNVCLKGRLSYLRLSLQILLELFIITYHDFFATSCVGANTCVTPTNHHSMNPLHRSDLIRSQIHNFDTE